MAAEEDNITKEKTIFDLPIHCLRSIVEPLNLRDRIRASAVSTVFREVIETSECCADDQLIFEAYNKYIIHEELIEGKLRNISELKVCYCVSYTGVIIRQSISADEGQDIFEKMQRFFTALHLKELIVYKVPLEEDIARSFNAFVDEHCSFDRFVLRTSNTSIDRICDRTRELMARAKKGIIIEMACFDVTPELLQSIPSPGPHHIRGVEWERTIQAIPYTASSGDVQYFMDLVRQGHTLEKLTAPITRGEDLTEVIEMVVSTSIPQKLDVKFGRSDTLGFFEIYLAAVKATEVHGHTPPEDDWLHNEDNSGYQMEIRTYNHRGATIFIYSIRTRTQKQTVPNRARVMVTSRHYENS